MTVHDQIPKGLPGGAALAPGESVLVADRFMFSTLAFYLHTDLVLTNRRLYAVRPNTILGLIPVGTGRSNFPVENIAGVNAGTRFDVLGVIFGAFALLFGLGALPSGCHDGDDRPQGDGVGVGWSSEPSEP
jgi:hypothetical protein